MGGKVCEKTRKKAMECRVIEAGEDWEACAAWTRREGTGAHGCSCDGCLGYRAKTWLELDKLVTFYKITAMRCLLCAESGYLGEKASGRR